MIEPGLYRMNFRGLTLREAWRFSTGPLTFVIAVVLKAIGFKGASLWLPPHDAEAVCDEAALSEAARRRLLPEVEKARALGYGDGRFIRPTRIDDPSMKEGFAYLALHADRSRSLFVAYVLNNASGTEKASLTVTGAIHLADGAEIVFANHRNYFDGEPSTRHVLLAGRSLAEIDAAMAAELARLGMNARAFSHWQEMRSITSAGDERAYEGRIRRGLVVRVRE